MRVRSFLTTKAATFCPPPVLADLWRQLARVASRRAPHALLMVVHEVVGAQHAPARARLRLAAVLVARGLRAAGAARRGSLGPSDSEATLLRLGGPAVRRSGKHEAAVLFTPHDGSARNVPRQGAKVHQLASEIPLRLPDVRSACAVTDRH